MAEDGQLKLFLQNAKFIIFPLLQNPDLIKEQAEEMSMDGKNILKACEMLRIEYAKFSNMNNETQDSNSQSGDPAVDVTSHADQGTLVAATASNQAGHMTSAGLNGALGTGSVLYVKDMKGNVTECYHLFVLFGVYGDVQRVKIMHGNFSSALVQMSDPQQAMLAMNHLDKIKLWGNVIRVRPSKHTTVELTKENQIDTGLTQDYSNSYLHRFRNPASKNYSNIYPPSSTLHLSNIPTSIQEHDLQTVFNDIGICVQAFDFFPHNQKMMAKVKLINVDEAITALLKLHDYQLSETSHLRVSFAGEKLRRR